MDGQGSRTGAGRAGCFYGSLSTFVYLVLALSLSLEWGDARKVLLEQTESKRETPIVGIPRNWKELCKFSMSNMTTDNLLDC